jgi:hypothetical protein
MLLKEKHFVAKKNLEENFVQHTKDAEWTQEDEGESISTERPTAACVIVNARLRQVRQCYCYRTPSVTQHTQKHKHTHTRLLLFHTPQTRTLILLFSVSLPTCQLHFSPLPATPLLFSLRWHKMSTRSTSSLPRMLEG